MSARVERRANRRAKRQRAKVVQLRVRTPGEATGPGEISADAIGADEFRKIVWSKLERAEKTTRALAQLVAVQGKRLESQARIAEWLAAVILTSESPQPERRLGESFAGLVERLAADARVKTEAAMRALPDDVDARTLADELLVVRILAGRMPAPTAAATSGPTGATSDTDS